MQTHCQIPITVSFRDADDRGKLSLTGLFSYLTIAAAAHTEQIDLSQKDLEKQNMGWLVLRTRVRIKTLPDYRDHLLLTTRSEAPIRGRCDRFFQILRDGECLIQAKNEWAIWNHALHRPVNMAAMIPTEFTCHEPDEIGEYFAIEDNFREPAYDQYRVRSFDIDMNHHMNNVSYVRAMTGTFSCETLRQMNISEIDVIYKMACYEGDTLLWQKYQADDRFNIRASLSDDKTIFLASLKLN